METSQISLTVPTNLLAAARKYISKFNFRSVQELIIQTLRERVSPDYTQENIKHLEKLLELSIKTESFKTREDLMKALG